MHCILYDIDSNGTFEACVKELSVLSRSTIVGIVDIIGIVGIIEANLNVNGASCVAVEESGFLQNIDCVLCSVNFVRHTKTLHS